MTSTLLYTILILSGLGALLAIILYVVAQKFKVFEDPLIDQVQQVLPGANCGGCGSAGCHAFAESCVKAESLDGRFCPVGGNQVMAKVAEVLGKTVAQQEPRVAVLRCAGTCEVRGKSSVYDGLSTCAAEAALYGGDSTCAYGCLGLGDCAAACSFGAISVDPALGIAVVDEEKCTSCGSCVKACPKGLLELRPKGPKNRRVYVACSNKDKGFLAKKACKAACIGCCACVKACPFEAVTVTDFLAYIDPAKCRMCRKCVAVCPSGGIKEVNFPPKKEVKQDE